MKIIVTGILGQDGANMVEYLLEILIQKSLE